MAKTKQPSGLSIARDSMKFECSWKIADEDYGDGIQFRWRNNLTAKGKWESEVTLGAKVTSRTVSLTAASYYPTTNKKLTTITFSVRGKRKAVTKTENDKTTTTTYDWSEWVQKNYTLNLPNVPSLTATLSDDYASKFHGRFNDWFPSLNVMS